MRQRLQALRPLLRGTWPWFRREARLTEKLRTIWDGSNQIDRKFDLIRLFHDFRQPDLHETVDDKTWSDLEMDEVFASLDRTVGSVGRQYLYSLLRTWEPDLCELRRRASLRALFRSNPDLREAIQRELYRLRHDDAYFVVSFLSEELPERPPACFLIYLASAAFFGSLITGFFVPAFFLIAAGLAAINLTINVLYGSRVFQYFGQLTFLTSLLTVASRLAALLPPGRVAEIDVLRKHRTLAVRLNRRMFWLCVDEARLNEISSAFFIFLNVFGLSKLVAFLRSVDDLRSSRAEIRAIFDAVGSLDALLAAAGYEESLGPHCQPILNANGLVDVAGIYHPLIGNPVGNSFRLESRSALITGSNLAGKTTFIKTIGVNLILARTLYMCLAESAILPEVTVRASIKHDDRVLDGHSYYSREIEQIATFVRCPPDSCLLLIDEIFRGTNTVERVAIAAATVRYLSDRNLVLVTTHDVELQELLADCSRMFHFSEVVEGGKYFFDYRLRPGPCGAGNAVKLIELRQFPREIVEAARRRVEELQGLTTDGLTKSAG
ncbi:MAG: hypothetical protein EHM61_27995 [Acidobacteria bacterium]|nr:MAG: hypothetical protein EHM61_27995 [Acidobacteriota bacterium]